MRPPLMTDSRKDIGVYHETLNVGNPIGSVMAYFKEHGTQYDAMGNQQILRSNTKASNRNIPTTTIDTCFKIYAKVDLDVPI